MCASFGDDKFMIIDDLDELVETIRTGMIRIILQSGIACVSVAAMNGKEKVSEIAEKLKKVGGRCYWIENAVAVEL